MSAPMCVNPDTWFSTHMVVRNSYSLHDSIFHPPHKILDLKLPKNQNRDTKLLMDHKAKDDNNGRTAIFHLNGTLEKLILVIKFVPPKVNGTVAEFTNKISSLITIGRVLHYKNIKETNKYNLAEGGPPGGWH